MKKVIMYFILCNMVLGNEIYIASVAGYKQVVKDIVKSYEKAENKKVNCIFGNKQQIITYLRNSERISLVIGDELLKKKIEKGVKKAEILGKGKLVLAFRKESNIKKIEDLKKIEKLGIPDPKKTIYGDAAIQALNSKMMYGELADKFLSLKTVPQVSLYLEKGELDAGFINYTDYINISHSNIDKLEIDKSLYNDIDIFAIMLNEKALSFYNYLFLDAESKNILKKYGL